MDKLFCICMQFFSVFLLEYLTVKMKNQSFSVSWFSFEYCPPCPLPAPRWSYHKTLDSLRTGEDGEGNGKPLQYSCLGNPLDRGAWWVRVAKRVKLDLVTKHHRETETGGRRGEGHVCGHPGITAGTPVLHLHRPPAAWWLRALRGPLAGVCCWARKYTWHHTSEGVHRRWSGSPPAPCLPRTRCWFPVAAVNHSSRKKKHKKEVGRRAGTEGPVLTGTADASSRVTLTSPRGSSEPLSKRRRDSLEALNNHKSASGSKSSHLGHLVFKQHSTEVWQGQS